MTTKTDNYSEIATILRRRSNDIDTSSDDSYWFDQGADAIDALIKERDALRLRKIVAEINGKELSTLIDMCASGSDVQDVLIAIQEMCLKA